MKFWIYFLLLALARVDTFIYIVESNFPDRV